MASKAYQFRTVPAASLDRRAEPRHPVHITRVTARADRAKILAADLRDISTYGCRLASPTRHVPGARLWLGLNGSPRMAATVVWCADGHIGCRFDDPLPRTLLRQLVMACPEPANS